MEELFESEILYRVKAKDVTLYIIYDKGKWGLHELFNDDEAVLDYVCKNTQEAYEKALIKHNGYSYILNVASTEDFGAFENDIPDKSLLDYQLSIYMPLIQKFMLDALTDSL